MRLEIYRKTNRIPRIDELYEEFPLFLKRDVDWKDLPVEMRWKFSNHLTPFLESKPLYASFEDFLIDAGIPSQIVKQQSTQ